MTRLLLVTLCTVGLFLPPAAFAKSKIDLARDYAKIEKKSEAKQLVNEAILDDPLDGEVHYQAGVVFFDLGQWNDFNLAMKNACSLKPNRCNDVAGLYYDLAFNSIDQKHNESAAERAFVNAFHYNQAKKDEAIRRLFDTGQDYFNRLNFDLGKQYFNLVEKFDSSYNERMGKAYFTAGKTAGLYECFRLFAKANELYPDQKKLIGEELIKRSQDSRNSDYHKALSLDAAEKYLSKDEIQELKGPPDYKIYQPGNYTFNLKAGETTDHWIMFPAGRNNNFDIKSDDNMFLVLFDDGDIDKAWETSRAKKRTRLKFKLKAVTDQDLTLINW